MIVFMYIILTTIITNDQYHHVMFILPQNGSEIEQLYKTYLSESSLNLTYLDYYQPCYDATWALGIALNKTLAGMKIISSLSQLD